MECLVYRSGADCVGVGLWRVGHRHGCDDTSLVVANVWMAMCWSPRCGIGFQPVETGRQPGSLSHLRADAHLAATQALIETVAFDQFLMLTAIGYAARFDHDDSVSHR